MFHQKMLPKLFVNINTTSKILSCHEFNYCYFMAERSSFHKEECGLKFYISIVRFVTWSREWKFPLLSSVGTMQYRRLHTLHGRGRDFLSSQQKTSRDELRTLM
jgi:hypothetical protein